MSTELEKLEFIKKGFDDLILRGNNGCDWGLVNEAGIELNKLIKEVRIKTKNNVSQKETKKQEELGISDYFDKRFKEEVKRKKGKKIIEREKKERETNNKQKR